MYKVQQLAQVLWRVTVLYLESLAVKWVWTGQWGLFSLHHSQDVVWHKTRRTTGITDLPPLLLTIDDLQKTEPRTRVTAEIESTSNCRDREGKHKQLHRERGHKQLKKERDRQKLRREKTNSYRKDLPFKPKLNSTNNKLPNHLIKSKFPLPSPTPPILHPQIKYPTQLSVLLGLYLHRKNIPYRFLSCTVFTSTVSSFITESSFRFLATKSYLHTAYFGVFASWFLCG